MNSEKASSQYLPMAAILAFICFATLLVNAASADERQCDDYTKAQPETERAFWKLVHSFDFTEGYAPEYICNQRMESSFALVQRSFRATGCEEFSDVATRALHWAELEKKVEANQREIFGEILTRFRATPRSDELSMLCGQLAGLDPEPVDVNSYESVSVFAIERMNLSRHILRISRSETADP